MPIYLTNVPRAPHGSPWRRRYLQLHHNLGPSAINRRDRATLRTWYLVLYVGPWCLDLCGAIRRRKAA